MENFLREKLLDLKAAGVADPAGDFEYFCEQSFGADWCRTRKANGFDNLKEQDKSTIEDFFARRQRREPVERILGKSRILNEDFLIEDFVFRPGRETETTIEYGLKAIENRASPRILDCGTGSGCILLSILKERQDASGTGVDIDAGILSVAQKNSVRLGSGNRANFLVSDWGQDLEVKFDLIISNPPRIPALLVAKLVKEVSAFDPDVALNGGRDGCDFYRRTAMLMRSHGHENSVCIMQVGELMLKPVMRIIARAGFANVRALRDYKYAPNCIIFENRDYKKPGYLRQLLAIFITKGQKKQAVSKFQKIYRFLKKMFDNRGSFPYKGDLLRRGRLWKQGFSSRRPRLVSSTS